ncbi:MAG: hypothetical protein Q4G51_08155 [Dermatophilus congolensis]|nr:hypothetical protein [Dermatophilus congolensis]
MSAVTAAVLIGSTPRVGAGIMPRWIALLHEGSSYAWHLLRLQLSVGELGDHSRDDPPGVLWRASSQEDIAGELALMLHLYAARTPEIVQLTKRIRHMQRRRVDLSGLQGVEAVAFENALRVARSRGRELRLAATILPGSRLTDDHLLSLPDWELEVSYSAFSRDWSHAGGLVIREHTVDDFDGSDGLGVLDLTASDEHDDEFFDDSDTHAVAEHPGNLAASGRGAPRSAQPAHEPTEELVGAAEAQSRSAGAVVQAASGEADEMHSSALTGTISKHAPHESGHDAEFGAEHGQEPAHVSGAGSAWLERDDSGPAETRGRGFFDRWRFNR